jgi:hypothetical protein
MKDIKDTLDSVSIAQLERDEAHWKAFNRIQNTSKLAAEKTRIQLLEEQLFEQRQQLNSLEKEHPTVNRVILDQVNKIAMTLVNLGRNDEAVRSYRREIEGRRRLFSLDDDNTLGAMFGLSKLLSDMNRYEEWIPLLRIVASEWKKKAPLDTIYLMLSEAWEFKFSTRWNIEDRTGWFSSKTKPQRKRKL